MKKKWVRVPIGFVLFLIVSMFVMGRFKPVQATGSSGIITVCPKFKELQDAINTNGVVMFALGSDCTVYFDAEIPVYGYVNISNTGSGKLIFDGRGSDGDADNDTRFFTVSSTGSLELENLTLQNGSVDGRGGAINNIGGVLSLNQVTLYRNKAVNQGGAIYTNGGTVLIDQSTFRQNQTTDGIDTESGNGGAIYTACYLGITEVTIHESTFDGNHTGASSLKDSGHGGAIYHFNSTGTTAMNIFNSTFFNNYTGHSLLAGSGDGGAVYGNNYGGTMTVSVFNSTFSANKVGGSTDGDFGDGGAIYLRNSTLSMAGSILANSGITSIGSRIADCASYDGFFNDGGYNIVEDAGECEFNAVTTSQVDPALYFSPGNYGGLTQTIPVNSSSQAVNAIPVGRTAFGVHLCGYDYSDQDQRGEYRPGGEACDIGAYEIVDGTHPYTLPSAGFAPGYVTNIVTPLMQLSNLAAEDGGMLLSIPTLNVQVMVLGVPRNGLGWDVNWLGDAVGYLEGTTFPTWDGNSVLVGHKVNALGMDSVFSMLSNLVFGDRVVIHAWGQQYTYEVRSIDWVDANDLSVLEDADENMLTLITCDGFDRSSGEYHLRVVVRAYLVSVK